MSGFYLMHRGWQDDPIFRNEPFSRRDAFVWLIEEAAYADRKTVGPKGEILLSRGQLSASFRFMAKAWRWDEARVRRFISSLHKDEKIDAATDAGQTVITVCNYEKYQNPFDEPDAATDAAATRRRRGGDANEKEGKEVSNYCSNEQLGISPVGSTPPLFDLTTEQEDPDKLLPRHIMDEWNDLAGRLGFPKILKLTPTRGQLMKARIADYVLNDFLAVFGKIEASAFLRGDTRHEFKCNFDWVFKKANFQKILEGNYDR